MKLGIVVGSLLLLAAASPVFAGDARAQASEQAAIGVPASGRTWTLRTADYTERHVEGDQIVQFTGDELAAPATGAYGMSVVRPPGVLRAGLVRPRVNFFPELLRSVENL